MLESTILTTRDEILDVASEALTRAGATEADALIQAGMLVEAEERGHPSHGLRRLSVLAGRLRAGLVVSGIEPVHEWTSPATLLVDGREGLGPVVAFAAVDAIIERARTTGVAVAALRRTHHIGMMAPYVERMTAAGCAGIALCTSEALVHAWGGVRALVGTNPIGIGVPTADHPVVLDMSTGATSAGRVLDHAAKGVPIPAGWAIDANGLPTTDASAAAHGAISPFGGAKGYALGVTLELLIASLTGSALGNRVHGTLDTEYPTTKGDLFIAFDLSYFPGVPASELHQYAEALRGSARSDSVVQLPGERSRESRASSMTGVAVDSAVWTAALDLAGRT